MIFLENNVTCNEKRFSPNSDVARETEDGGSLIGGLRPPAVRGLQHCTVVATPGAGVTEIRNEAESMPTALRPRQCHQGKAGESLPRTLVRSLDPACDPG